MMKDVPDMLNRIGSCAEALRQHADRLPGTEQESTTTLIGRLQQLSLRAEAENLISVKKIADTVCRSLTRINALPSRLQQIESRNFSLAAEWMEQLARIYQGGMPEPKELIYDLLYSFALLEQAVLAQYAESSSLSDLFAEDPLMTSETWRDYVQNNDPFVDDPGFGPLLDLLQRTLNHVTDVRADVPNDPFSQDPQVVANDAAEMLSVDPS